MSPVPLGFDALLTDSRGGQRRFDAGGWPGFYLTLPYEMAEGEASIRVGRSGDDLAGFSEPLKFTVTSGPLPLKPEAIEWMRPVASGQWTDLGIDHELQFEIRRVDRVEVEFQQEAVTELREATGSTMRHVEVPARLAPGIVIVRTRTWIDETASEWFKPAPFRVLGKPVPPVVHGILRRPFLATVWWAKQSPRNVAPVTRGETLIMHGDFPVSGGADLHVQIRNARTTIDLTAAEDEGSMHVRLPEDLSSGKWRLFVGTRTGSIRELVTLLIP